MLRFAPGAEAEVVGCSLRQVVWVPRVVFGAGVGSCLIGHGWWLVATCLGQLVVVSCGLLPYAFYSSPGAQVMPFFFCMGTFKVETWRVSGSSGLACL